MTAIRDERLHDGRQMCRGACLQPAGRPWFIPSPSSEMGLSIVMTISVCLPVCEHMSVNTRLHHVTYLWPWLGPPSGSVVIRCILPVLWTTSYLHTVGRMQGCWCSSGSATQPGGATRPGLAWLGRGPCLLQQAGSPLRCDVGLFIIPVLVRFPRPCWIEQWNCCARQT